MLLKIPKHGISSAGVSICFSYLILHQEVMDRIVLLPQNIIVDFVKYVTFFYVVEIKYY